ncbi:MAG: hypothetical protein LBM07_07875 [Culturomica sp.]|nr:hypothetical protein [Culturomica sp.]
MEAGDYKINVTKTDYVDLVNYPIKVKAGEDTEVNVQIGKQQPLLRITDSNGDDIDSLNFGSGSAVTANFNFFNAGTAVLTWSIVESSEWITDVSKTEGSLQPGMTQEITITIDRDLLDGGNNVAKLYFNSNDGNGNKEFTVTATGVYRMLPTLNTLAATDVTTQSATLNGEILTNGTPEYTERGFVYSESSMPTLETTISKITASITEDSLYSSGISDLSIGHTYYVRAYAINAVGTAYSTNEINFTTVTSLPTLSTQAATNVNIGAGTATFNGTILTVGIPAYTERGFVYGTTANPTLENTKVVASGTGTGAFNANVTGLTAGSTYHVRAYATNSTGTAYGEDVSFDFSATLPTLSTQAATNVNIGAGTATFNGTILTVGIPAYTERGFVYATTANPTLADSKVISTGTGEGTFNANVTSLTAGSTYHVRAYATNSTGTAYGEEVSFYFSTTLPTVSTQAVSNRNIAAGTATFSGTILTVGIPAYTERGFVYGTTANPTLADSKVISTGTGEGVFNANVTSLTEGNTYYVRAYATNSTGTAYGNQVSLDFNAVMPTVTTQPVTDRNIAAGTATFNGTILTAGDPAYTERGFVYDTTSNPTLENTKVVASGTGEGTFNANVTGLTEGNVYYVRAYATNSKGTRYGEPVGLYFNAVMPTVTTQPVTNINIAAGAATFNGTIESVGDPAYTERGFVYGTSHNPTTDSTKITVSGNTEGTFSANATGIAGGATYYVRAYATNSKGTVYGNEVSVVFNAVMPEVSTQPVTNINISAGTATFNGTILTAGAPAYTERGFVYGTSHNPTVDSTKITVSGSTAGAFSANATGIAEGATYYVRAYATNSEGTVYGGEVSVDFNATLPTVMTRSVSDKNVAAGTATFNGTLVSVGDLPITERGFVYGTSHNPTTDSTKITVSGSTEGTFSANATGISEGATYYVRAYATNSKGTVYGDEVSVDFNAVMPTLSTQAVTNKNVAAGTATFNGTILTLGDLAYTERGFVYATTVNPTLNNTKIVVSGTGTGTFNANVTSLTKGNNYYVRAYATNSKGTVYGGEVSVEFNVVMPTVSTQAVTDRNVAAGTATFNGTILTLGDLAYTERGFVYATTTNPTLDDTEIVVSGTDTVAFNANATGLTEGNTYYVRAYATNSKGTVYGNQVSFDFSNCVDFTDSRDGQIYPIVRIGTQCWMSKNMNVGTRVAGSNYTTHQTAGIQKICYLDDESNCTTYGGLYSWDETVNGENSGSIKYVSGSSTVIQGICPDGWHVPSDAEFKTLEMELGMTESQADGEYDRGTDEGRELKSTNLWEYYSSFVSGTNTSGWDGRPGGYRSQSGGTFNTVGTNGSWWSSSVNYSAAWIRSLSFGTAKVNRFYNQKSYGYSVRCLLN